MPKNFALSLQHGREVRSLYISGRLYSVPAVRAVDKPPLPFFSSKFFNTDFMTTAFLWSQLLLASPLFFNAWQEKYVRKLIDANI